MNLSICFGSTLSIAGTGHGAYDHLCTGKDRSMLPWILKFNQYDLYSKGHTKPDVQALKPYYNDLFAEFLPPTLAW